MTAKVSVVVVAASLQTSIEVSTNLLPIMLHSISEGCHIEFEEVSVCIVRKLYQPALCSCSAWRYCSKRSGALPVFEVNLSTKFSRLVMMYTIRVKVTQIAEATVYFHVSFSLCLT